jgi:hypothetical protein
VAGGGLTWARAPFRNAPPCDETQVRAALGHVWVGTQIERWTVVAVGDAQHGGIPVTLATKQGVRFRVDVLRRDDQTLGVANTSELSLYLCNQGHGEKATCEEHGLGAMALARALEKAHAAGAPVPALLTLRERNRRFSGGAFSVIG